MAKTGKIADLVTWLLMTNNGVVINNNGTIQKTFVYEAQDTTSMTDEELSSYTSDINMALRRLKSNYMLFFEMQKVKDEDYLEITDENELQAEFDTERKERINQRSFKLKYFLTVVYKQPPTAYEKLNNAIDADNKTLANIAKQTLKDIVNVFNPRVSMETIEAGAEQYRANLSKVEENFLDDTEEFIGLLQRKFVSIRALNKQETLSYLHSTISDTWHTVKTDINAYITEQLSDSTFLGGREPKLGKYNLGIIGIKDLPTEVYADIFDELRNFKSEFRYCVRYIALGINQAKQEALNLQKNHRQRSKNPITLVLEAVFNKESGKVDEAALLDADEAGEVYLNIESGAAGAGYMSLNFILFNENKEILKEELNSLRQIINGKDFVAFIEKDNSTAAWLSTIPSCYEFNVRRYLVHSLTLAACAPLCTLWEGQKKNKHLNAPALLKCKTREALPFYLSLHVDDIGHTFIAGPTGSGKSVLLNTIAAHFQKYPNARVFIFDKGSSSRVLTEAMGGNFYNLLVDTDSISFQPLARIEDSNEQSFIVEWLHAYGESLNVSIDNEDRTVLENALKTVAEQPLNSRTLTVLATAVQSEKWRSILRTLLMPDKEDSYSGGLYGQLFDNNVDKFGEGRWQAFEMDKLMQNERIVGLTLDYLFHRIESTLTGNPTLIILDECWLFLDHPAFRKKIEDYIRTLRKANASIIMATQNLTDISGNMLNIVTSSNVQTKILLANRTITDPEMYYKFGLNDQEIKIIMSMQPKGEYYYKSPLGSRVFDLGLLNEVVDPNKKKTIESIFVTATDVSEQRKAIEIGNEVKHDPKAFIKAWKEYKF